MRLGKRSSSSGAAISNAASPKRSRSSKAVAQEAAKNSQPRTNSAPVKSAKSNKRQQINSTVSENNDGDNNNGDENGEMRGADFDDVDQIDEAAASDDENSAEASSFDDVDGTNESNEAVDEIDENIGSDAAGGEIENVEIVAESSHENEKFPQTSQSSPTSAPPLSSSNLNSFNDKLSQTGVIYFSRLPPHTKPSNLRSILQSYGEIGRIFLTPSKNKHSKSKFTDGWVEFMSKSLAKRLALTLNNTLIGGRKRSRFHDDLWNCLYLRGFKWQHLTEKLAFERRERDQRLRHELNTAKQETEEYRRQVEKAKIQNKKRAKLEKRGNKIDDGNEADKKFRTFHQRPVISD